MKHRHKTIAEKDKDGEFVTYDEWARLGPQPPYRSATFFDAQGLLAAFSVSSVRQ